MIYIISEYSLGNSDAFSEEREIRNRMKREYDQGNLNQAKAWAEKLIAWQVPDGDGIAYEWAVKQHNEDVRWASKILEMTDADMQKTLWKYGLGHLLKAVGFRKHDKMYKTYLGMLMRGELSTDDVFSIIQ